MIFWKNCFWNCCPVRFPWPYYVLNSCNVGPLFWCWLGFVVSCHCFFGS
uniref:Uncharacterized protein n=1 Tax=Arundo donax TaxID=35708 RepID=A0A0A9G3U2_ARUDO